MFLLSGCTQSATPIGNDGRRDVITENSADPYLWLEDVTGERAMEWVKGQNAISTRELAGTADFAAMRGRLLAIMNSKRTNSVHR